MLSKKVQINQSHGVYYSIRLDISPTSRHTRRRIWQESISVLSLLTPECMMPKNEKLVYTDLKTLPVPPYLLRFRGTAGERHVENLKVHNSKIT